MNFAICDNFYSTDRKTSVLYRSSLETRHKKNSHLNDSAPTNPTSAGILTYEHVYITWIVNHFSLLYPVISVLQVFDRNQTEKLFYVHAKNYLSRTFKTYSLQINNFSKQVIYIKGVPVLLLNLFEDLWLLHYSFFLTTQLFLCWYGIFRVQAKIRWCKFKSNWSCQNICTVLLSKLVKKARLLNSDFFKTSIGKAIYFFYWNSMNGPYEKFHYVFHFDQC